MIDQSVTGKNLHHLLLRGDRKKYSLGTTRKQYREALNVIAERILDKEYQFSPFHVSKQSHGRIFTTSNKEDEFAIRKLNDNIKRVYSIKSNDRNIIIPQIITLIKETTPFYIVKVDIEKFFENIDRKNLLEILLSDSSLSYITRELLKKLFNSQQLKNYKGLPRGLSISSTLAEYCLKEFDKKCRRLSYCYYYVRYVDDMLFFFHELPEDILFKISSFLPFGLRINYSKSSVIKPDQISTEKVKVVTYLGYQFKFVNYKKHDVQVSISPQKIKKIKTRIILALRDYIKNRSFDLLLLRIKFLSSNYRVSGKKQNNTLYSGIYYNYRHIDVNGLDGLADIDDFLKKAIFSKRGTLGKKLSMLLTEDQKRILCSHSIKLGHEKIMHRNFKSSELKEIKRTWNYV